MPAYHSVFLDEPNQTLIGNFALLPLRTKTRGPAQQLAQLPPGTSDLDLDPSNESYDPLDEILSLFRANTFFRNFEIKGPADRVLIYGILYTTSILTQIKPTMSRREAEKAVMNVALETNFAIPITCMSRRGIVTRQRYCANMPCRCARSWRSGY